jgi:hypothetical protein
MVTFKTAAVSAGILFFLGGNPMANWNFREFHGATSHDAPFQNLMDIGKDPSTGKYREQNAIDMGYSHRAMSPKLANGAFPTSIPAAQTDPLTRDKGRALPAHLLVVLKTDREIADASKCEIYAVVHDAGSQADHEVKPRTEFEYLRFDGWSLQNDPQTKHGEVRANFTNSNTDKVKELLVVMHCRPGALL